MKKSVKMKLNYKSIDKQITRSFHTNRQTDPYLGSNWHFHEEYELIYHLKGKGIRIVGDDISGFAPPQLALVGSKLPHLWKNDIHQARDQKVDTVIIQFNRLFAGQDIFSIPEFQCISELLKSSQRGILFGKKTIIKIHPFLISLINASEPKRLIDLQYILMKLAESDDKKLISSREFTLPVTLAGGNRLNKVINYISENYTRPIDLDELARESAMTRTSLCRFFKNKTNKTIFQFINEFRLGKACQMLISDNHSISDICYESGFNSSSSFYRIFKEIKHTSPQEYQKKYAALK